jgi:hypothetical protein
MAWRRGHRGRPKLANAKRRATTLAGRRPEADHGTDQLRYRKLRAANGSAAMPELVDIGGILAAHNLLDDQELAVLRLLSSCAHQVCVAFALSRASPGGLWAALLSGQRAGLKLPITTEGGRTGGDSALFRLGQLHQHFGQLGRLNLRDPL